MFTKTVDSITSKLGNMVKQLTAHAAAMEARSAQLTAEMDRLHNDRREADIERTKALSAAEKINALLA